jgi:hypothetical protein
VAELARHATDYFGVYEPGEMAPVRAEARARTIALLEGSLAIVNGHKP